MQEENGAPDLPEDLTEPYLCDLLKLSPIDLRAMDLEEVAAHTAYHEGKGLAEWANQTDQERAHGPGKLDHQSGPR